VKKSSPQLRCQSLSTNKLEKRPFEEQKLRFTISALRSFKSLSSPEKAFLSAFFFWRKVVSKRRTTIIGRSLSRKMTRSQRKAVGEQILKITTWLKLIYLHKSSRINNFHFIQVSFRYNMDRYKHIKIDISISR